jgi:hypothetical protein
MLQKLNETPLERFLSDELVPCSGNMIKFSEFYARLMDWLDPEDKRNWSKIRVGRELSTQYPRARQRGTGQFHIANIRWKEDNIESGSKLIMQDGYLEHENEID